MKSPVRFIKIAMLAFAVSQPLMADTPISLTQGSSGTWNADWNGLADRTDFVQWSLDLQDWHFAPVVEYGGGVKSYGFTSSSSKFFVRLQQAYIPSTDPEGDDYDGDGLSNIDEVTLHDTNPLEWDTDGDGMEDGWEIANNLDPRDDGSIDPLNGANGDSDGDGLSNLYESYLGSNPNVSDTDGDGLSDGDEVFNYSTSPTSDDSDWDNLTDGDEVTLHGTDPAKWDTDDDTLSDAYEIFDVLTDPLKMDTDGDWMWDDWELNYGLDPTDLADGLLDADSDGLANQLEFVFIDKGYDPFTADAAGFPWSADPDYDGLTTTQEFTVHVTNPRQPDTDNDGMDDGWEILFGFNAKANNLTDANPNNDESADPDDDTLTNGQESGYSTSPSDPNTDGDGVNDDVEVTQGSNPNDPNDQDPPPGGTVEVNVNFGDHSQSHSEKYRVKLEPVEGDTQVRERSNRKYGETQTDTFHLPKGAKYTVTLVHIGTRPTYREEPNPDYDYTLEIPQVAAADQSLRIIKDPQGIMGVHDEGDSFFASGKSADLFVMQFKTETISLSPPNQRDRKKLGVKEESEVTVTPNSAGVINWSLENQKNATVAPAAGYSVLFTADTRKKGPTLRATFDTGDIYDIVWEVVEPDGERAEKTVDLTYAAGTQGAGMKLKYTTLPDDVSFYQVEVLEVDKGTSNIRGFFSPFTAAELKHTPNSNWERLYPDNHWDDNAFFSGWGFPHTWEFGTYQWDIEVKWRTAGEGGNGLFLGNRTQLHTIHDSTGRSTESKSGQSATRTP